VALLGLGFNVPGSKYRDVCFLRWKALGEKSAKITFICANAAELSLRMRTRSSLCFSLSQPGFNFQSLHGPTIRRKVKISSKMYEKKR
jgi:hypothetical protein